MKEKKIVYFYFSYKLDDERKLVRCFWVNLAARRAYKIFGPIINTTYNTNIYDIIFAPLTWVNHHGQTIIFGCGTLSNKKK